jgi:hypothetical protein
MAYSIIAPSFLREYIDTEHPENNAGRVRYVVSPHSVDYVVMLSNAEFCKRILEQKEVIAFTKTSMKEEDEASFIENAKLLTEKFPIMTHYWPIRQMMMYILQFRDYNIDRRMLILNHCLGVVDGMQKQFKQDMIPQYAVSVTHTADFTEVFKYFDKLPVAMPISLREGVGFLKFILGTIKISGTQETYAAFKRVYDRVFKGLGVSGPETLGLIDMSAYAEKRRAFAVDFQGERAYALENLLVNLLWEFAIPFTNPEQSMWDNFIFYIHTYNALKILMMATEPKDNDDLANIISVFDKALNEANNGNNFFNKITTVVKNSNTGNNGDLAVIAIS